MSPPPPCANLLKISSSAAYFCITVFYIGIWSQSILSELQTSGANLEATVKVVNGKIDQQQTQIIGNGMADICWKSEANQRLVIPDYPPDIVKLCENLEYYRKCKT